MTSIQEGSSDSQDCDEEDVKIQFERAEGSTSNIEDECPRVPSTSTSQSSSTPQMLKPLQQQEQQEQSSKQSNQEDVTVQEVNRETLKQQTHHHQSSQSSSHRGYYDAEKCRAHIANQIRVSKIDRFAAQANKAVEVESSVCSRLSGIFNMFMNLSAQLTLEFTTRCKMSLKRHRQDRILSRGNSKKSKPTNLGARKHKSGSKITKAGQNNRPIRIVSDKFSTISNDLLYGQGVQLLQTLFAQTTTSNSKSCPFKEPIPTDRHIKSETPMHHVGVEPNLNLIDNALLDSFEPKDYVAKLNEFIRKNMRKSRLINSRLSAIRQMFERLATEHRDKVDLVYSAEEERQSTTVVRRSAYNLSLAAIKATRTPIHVNMNSNEM